MTAAKAATWRHRIGQYANPWHDQIGRFAPKGTGTMVSTADRQAAKLTAESTVESRATDEVSVEANKERRDAAREYGTETDAALANGVEAWTGAKADPWVIRDRLAAGDREALLFQEVVAQAPSTTKPLYRGMWVHDDESYNRFAALREGDVINATAIASFTESKHHAESFMGPNFENRPIMDEPGGQDGVLVTLEPGSRALPVSTLSNTPSEQEWLTTGQLVVTSVKKRAWNVGEDEGGYDTYRAEITVKLVDEADQALAASAPLDLADWLGIPLHLLPHPKRTGRSEFANPWHDQLGRFAPKGTGKNWGVKQTGKTPAPAPDESDRAFAEKYGNERRSGDGDCYPTALHVAKHEAEVNGPADRYRVVHGVPEGQGPLEGVRFGHGWVERTDPLPDAMPPESREMFEKFGMNVVVLDKSNGNNVEMPRMLYYQLGHIQEDDVVRYTVDEAWEHALRTGHYGPWE